MQALDKFLGRFDNIEDAVRCLNCSLAAKIEDEEFLKVSHEPPLFEQPRAHAYANVCETVI